MNLNITSYKDVIKERCRKDIEEFYIKMDGLDNETIKAGIRIMERMGIEDWDIFRQIKMRFGAYQAYQSFRQAYEQSEVWKQYGQYRQR